MIQREATRHLERRFKECPVVTVPGPRQSGNTTLCRDTFPSLAYANLEASDVRQVATQTMAHYAHACRVAQAVQKVDGVEQVILFGSRARGDFQPESDLDLVVVYATTKTRSDVFLPCVQAAKDATVDVYGRSVSVDITPLAADHFDFMQHGINHVAAHAAREGITPMGYRCQPPSEPGEPSLSEYRRRESMERAWHAHSHLTTLTNVHRLGVDA